MTNNYKRESLPSLADTVVEAHSWLSSVLEKIAQRNLASARVHLQHTIALMQLAQAELDVAIAAQEARK